MKRLKRLLARLRSHLNDRTYLIEFYMELEQLKEFVERELPQRQGEGEPAPLHEAPARPGSCLSRGNGRGVLRGAPATLRRCFRWGNAESNASYGLRTGTLDELGLAAAGGDSVDGRCSPNRSDRRRGPRGYGLDVEGFRPLVRESLSRVRRLRRTARR
jgi:hypothetical protein